MILFSRIAERIGSMIFRKTVAIDPVALTETARKEILRYTQEFEIADDVPADDEEIVRRIGDADAALLSAASRIDAQVMERCPNLRYIGMCCSLYSEESANVDIPYARSHGITVKGIRDYGDRGVAEYVVWELVRLYHGYGCEPFRGAPSELLGLKVGFVGFGTSGRMTAEALAHFGVDITYYARSQKPDAEEHGMHYLPLHDLLAHNEVIITCLNKNVILLHEKEFGILGDGKVMINTSIGPAADMDALKAWIHNPKNRFCCDTVGAIGGIADDVIRLPNVSCRNASAGMTLQAYDLLSNKVLGNMEEYLRQS